MGMALHLLGERGLILNWFSISVKATTSMVIDNRIIVLTKLCLSEVFVSIKCLQRISILPKYNIFDKMTNNVHTTRNTQSSKVRRKDFQELSLKAKSYWRF